MKFLLFCYGTLKKGHTRQKYLLDQRYLGIGTLQPTHRMVVLGGFPALIPCKPEEIGSRVRGELYEVSDEVMRQIDVVEGVAQGMFTRTSLKLESYVPVMLPTEQNVFDSLEKNEVEGYVYCRDVGHARDCGCFWW